MKMMPDELPITPSTVTVVIMDPLASGYGGENMIWAGFKMDLATTHGLTGMLYVPWCHHSKRFITGSHPSYRLLHPRDASYDFVLAPNGNWILKRKATDE